MFKIERRVDTVREKVCSLYSKYYVYVVFTEREELKTIFFLLW